MKNIYEVLRQKELELQQLQKDIEALRVAVQLLSDDNHTGAGGRPATSSVTEPRMVNPADTLGPAARIRQFP
jgi:hypothetical protein